MPDTDTPTPRAIETKTTDLKLGVIGIDSSHLSEFTRRIHRNYAAGQTRCRVTQMWTDGQHKMHLDEVRAWQAQAQEQGVVMAESLDAMLDAVDGVMVLAVDGNQHLALAEKPLSRGMTTYIDKPLTCDLNDARKLLKLVRKHHARCYSASSLRFANEVRGLDKLDLGRLHAIEAYGPGALSPAMKGLFFYGIHTIEMVDAMWGGGVSKVRSDNMPDRDIVELRYHDGRYAHLRLERKGAYDFGATVHGSDVIHSFKVDFSEVYNRLIEGMTGFFEGSDPPAELERLVEAIAVIETAHRSVDLGGVWIPIPQLD